MTGYEASQAMRRLETGVREQKSIREAAKQSGDVLLERECTEKIKLYQSKYNEISNITGIAKEPKRMSIPKGTNTLKSIDFSGDSGIIELNRKTSNTGAFSVLAERMSKKHIRKLAKECDIDLKGITLDIDFDEEKLRLQYTGRADYEKIGQITFFPNAFQSKEELIRTLYHEIQHVKQYKKYGTQHVINNRLHFENEAYSLEEEFIAKIKERGII